MFHAGGLFANPGLRCVAPRHPGLRWSQSSHLHPGLSSFVLETIAPGGAERSGGTPLAVCDSSSIDPKDFVPSDLVYRDKVGETYRFTYNPNHRWFYFPRLERNEVILLKCYDSKEDGRARFTAHSAFEDPTSAPDAAPRESIEVRALVFWPADKSA